MRKRLKSWWIRTAYGCECHYWGYGSCSVCTPFTEEKLNWKHKAEWETFWNNPVSEEKSFQYLKNFHKGIKAVFNEKEREKFDGIRRPPEFKKGWLQCSPKDYPIIDYYGDEESTQTQPSA